MDINLENLKTEILDYLAASEFAIFRSHSGALESLPIISWDTERFPDYRMFLETAHKAGQKLVLFADRELEEDDLEEAASELEDAELPRDEKRDFTRRLREAKAHLGSTCSLELAFDYNSHLYVYEARPDWYDDFLELCDELASLFPVTEVEGGEQDGLGGYFSNN